MELNNDHWRDAEPFLTAGELKTTWAAFFGAQPHSLVKSKKQPVQVNKQFSQPNKKVKFGLGICFAYNNGTCAKAPGTCKTAKGKLLGLFFVLWCAFQN